MIQPNNLKVRVKRDLFFVHNRDFVIKIRFLNRSSGKTSCHNTSSWLKICFELVQFYFSNKKSQGSSSVIVVSVAILQRKLFILHPKAAARTTTRLNIVKYSQFFSKTTRNFDKNPLIISWNVRHFKIAIERVYKTWETYSYTYCTNFKRWAICCNIVTITTSDFEPIDDTKFDDDCQTRLR